MSGQCIDKLPHSCGTRRGLQVFAKEDGTVDGYCFSCSTVVRHPYGDIPPEEYPEPKVKSPEDIEKEMAEVEGYPTVSLPHKKLRSDTLEHYGVKVALSETDGKTPVAAYYPYTKDGKIVGYKAKIFEGKIIYSLGNIKGSDLFGWEEALKAGAYRLIITEGEDDAIAWKQILNRFDKEAYKDSTAVVSLPKGVDNAKNIVRELWPTLQKLFKETVLSFDMDEPGRAAVEEVCIACPGIKSIDAPSKDANQALLDGKGKTLYNSLFNAVVPKNSRIVSGGDVHKIAGDPPKRGELTWPWDRMNRDTRGIRLGETIYIGAGVKMGKSALANTMAAHFIKEHEVSILMAKPEEDNKLTYKLMAGQMEGRIFHDPEVEFDKEAYDRAEEKLDDKLYMLDIYQHMGWETLKEDIIYSATTLGVKAVFIDPITNLTAGLPSNEANTKLEEIATQIAALAKDLNIVVFLFCHLKAHEGNISRDKREKAYKDGTYIGLGNCPHELGGDVQSSQFAGSRAMMRSCHMMIGFQGNKDPEIEEDVRNIRQVKILEDRAFGVTGIYPVYYNKHTAHYGEA